MLLALPAPTPMHRQWSFAKLLILVKYHESSAPSPGRGEYTLGTRKFVGLSLFCRLTHLLTHTHSLSSHVHAGEDPPAEQVDVELVYAVHGTDYSETSLSVGGFYFVGCWLLTGYDRPRSTSARLCRRPRGRRGHREC